MIGILILLVLLPAYGQRQGGAVAPISVSDYTGTAATIQLFPAGGGARWVQLIAPTGNAATVRWGDSTTSVSKGGMIAAGGAMFLPPLSNDDRESSYVHLYDLSKLYAYIATGDKLTVIWVQ
jgi:hypothetical protein